MKKSVFFVIGGVLTVILASNMSYDQQTIIPSLKHWLQNKPLEGWLSQFEIHYWGKVISVESRGYFYFIEFLVRKATHFFGYGLLAVLFYLFYKKLHWRFPSLLAWLTIVMIASLDEYRQSMIPGRTGIIDDVYIDACGAITLLIFVKIIAKLRHIQKG
jgi:hypothetical protein